MTIASASTTTANFFVLADTRSYELFAGHWTDAEDLFEEDAEWIEDDWTTSSITLLEVHDDHCQVLDRAEFVPTAPPANWVVKHEAKTHTIVQVEWFPNWAIEAHEAPALIELDYEAGSLFHNGVVVDDCDYEEPCRSVWEGN